MDPRFRGGDPTAPGAGGSPAFRGFHARPVPRRPRLAQVFCGVEHTESALLLSRCVCIMDVLAGCRHGRLGGTMGAKIHTRITGTRRDGESVNGHHRIIMITDAGEFLAKPNGGAGYAAEDMSIRGWPVVLWLDAKGRVRRISAV